MSRDADTEKPAAPKTLEFTPSDWQPLMIVGLIVYCVLCCLFAVGTLLVRIFLIPERGGMLALHAGTTLPMILGTFGFIKAYYMGRAPRYVRLLEPGVEIGGKTVQRYRWSEIASVAVDESPGLSQKVVRLKDAQDKTLASISGVDNVDDLISVLKAKVVSSEPESRDPSKPTAVHRKRGRKRAIAFGLFGALMMFVSGFIISTGRWEAHKESAMQTRAVPGSGLIVERRVAPNGVTKRVYVKVTGSDDHTETHNFEVTDELFGAVEEGAEIDVIYVPDDPRIAKLAVEGQVFEDDAFKTPVGSYLLGAGGAVMSLGVLAAAILAWYGYDIKFDSEHRGLVPIGE